MNSRDADRTVPLHQLEPFRSYAASQEPLSVHRSCLFLDGFCLVFRLPERYPKSALSFQDALGRASR